jgi:hypothetical protein
MYIELDDIKSFHWGGTKFKLPSNIIRFNEFENVVVFLLDENKKRDKIVGVKFSQAEGINHFYIDWEFKVKDFTNNEYSIVSMSKQIFENKEVVYCYGWGFDIGYYLDPETGRVLHTEPIK